LVVYLKLSGTLAPDDLQREKIDPIDEVVTPL
jgi:hypothetical protein